MAMTYPNVLAVFEASRECWLKQKASSAAACMLLSLIICVLQQHLKKRQLAAAVVFLAMLELIESI